jgi:hypothetical protein
VDEVAPALSSLGDCCATPMGKFSLLIRAISLTHKSGSAEFFSQGNSEGLSTSLGIAARSGKQDNSEHGMEYESG